MVVNQIGSSSGRPPRALPTLSLRAVRSRSVSFTSKKISLGFAIVEYPVPWRDRWLTFLLESSFSFLAAIRASLSRKALLTQKLTADEASASLRQPAPAIHPFVGRGVWTVATSASIR